jgi:hypothetical protein
MRFAAPHAIVGDVTNLALHFHADHLADLRASSLSDETIRAAGMYSLRHVISNFSSLPAKVSRRVSRRRFVSPTRAASSHGSSCFRLWSK